MFVSFNKGSDPLEIVKAAIAAGRFAEAEVQCRQVLEGMPGSNEAMRLMAVICYHTGRETEALEWWERAIAAGDAAAMADLAEIRRVRGELTVAEDLARRAVSTAPGNANAHLVLAKVLAEQVNWEPAAAAGRRAAELAPQEEPVRAAVGKILFHHGRALEAARILNNTDADQQAELAAYLEAATHLEAAVRRNPLNVPACVDLAHAYERLERYDRAFHVMKHAVEVKPDLVATALQMAHMMLWLQWREEAEKYFRHVLARVPAHAAARTGLAEVLVARGKYAEAEEIARGVPGAAVLAEALARQGRFDEAQAAALALGGRQWAQTSSNVLLRAGKLDEALAAIDQALAGDEANPHLNVNKAIILLMMGRYAEGWKLWEWRSKIPGVYGRRRLSHVPRWDGSELGGKRILLLGEQGLGDTVQMVRFAEQVAARGGKVVVCCQKPLAELLKSVPGVSEVVEESPGVAERVGAQVWAPMMSMPAILGTTLETVPARVPYVRADAGKVSQWKEKLAGYTGLKVGLVWEGGGAHPENPLRSTSLETFAVLGSVPGVTLFGLQKGPAEVQAKQPPKGMTFVDLGPAIQDFSDTTAILENLDLLISVDTSVVHVAGAMGRPVWTLLAFSPGHMWMLEREDSPWYPTMRLFRQKTFGDWGKVIDHVRQELMVFSAAEHRKLADPLTES